MSRETSERTVSPPTAVCNAALSAAFALCPSGGFLTPTHEAADRQPPPCESPGLTFLSLAAVVGLLYYGQPLLVPVALALFLAFALRPFVSLLERAGLPRGCWRSC